MTSELQASNGLEYGYDGLTVKVVWMYGVYSPAGRFAGVSSALLVDL